MRTTLRALAATATTALLLSTTACGGDEVAERATEEAIEQLAEEEGVEVDVDQDGGEISVETEDGTITSGQGLPDGFPSDEVPLVDGTVVSGVGATGGPDEGFVVTLESDASAADAYADAAALLEGAGFSTDMEMGPTQGGWSSEAWSVFLAADDSAGTTTITYAVSPL